MTDSADKTPNPVLDRRQRMYSLIKSVPRGKPQTLSGLAARLGRKKNEAFGRDLRVVRHWALDDGHLITPCSHADEGEEQVFYFLREGQEDSLSERGLRVASAHARARVRNVGRNAEYVAKNAEQPEVRLLGKLNAHFAAFAESSMTAIEDYLKVREEQLKN